MRTALFLLLVLAGCASTPPAEKPTGPRGLRASEHVQAAREHDRMAHDRQRSWPEGTAVSPGSTEPVQVWYRTWDTAADHERLAREHNSAAAAIQAEYDDACKNLSMQEVATSPLRRFRTGGWNTANGVIVYLTPKAGSADEVLSLLRCHRAWMMLAPQAGMEDCPLDVPGLKVDARGDADGITLVLGVENPKLVGELQRRIAKEAEIRIEGRR